MRGVFCLSGGLGETSWTAYVSLLSRDSRESLTLQLAKKHEDNRGLGLIAWVPCSGRPGCIRAKQNGLPSVREYVLTHSVIKI